MTQLKLKLVVIIKVSVNTIVKVSIKAIFEASNKVGINAGVGKGRVKERSGKGLFIQPWGNARVNKLLWKLFIIKN